MSNYRMMFFGLWLAAGASIAAAGPVAVRDDFAYGYTLDPAPGFPVYQAVLPEEVYRVSRRDDLGDLRVFNAQGEPVPHALMPPSPAEAAARRMALPFFPLHGDDGASRQPLNVKVIRDQNGTIVNINEEPPKTGPRTVTGYLIDATRVETPLTKMYLQWEKSNGFVANVSLSSSDNLAHWSKVVDSAGIADLVHGGERLTRRYIEFRPVKAKYLRIDWPAAAQGSPVVAIDAEAAPVRQEPVATWLVLEAQRMESEAGTESFAFDTAGRFPVDRLNLELPENNSLLRATVWSRADAKLPWRQRHAGLFYRLQPGMPGSGIRNEFVPMTRTTDRYWRVDMAPDNGLGRRAPKLELGWRGDRVTFLARGSGPYTLAFGSHEAAGVEQPVEQLLRALEQKNQDVRPITAAVGERMVLGGEDRLQPGSRPVPWRKLVLWSVLIGGVLLLAGMAVGLMRQMGKPE